MLNRVSVNVAGRSYVLLAEEEETYVRQVADFVNEHLKETLAGSEEMTQVDCALLTALNIADEHLKGLETSESLRRQVKALLEENAQLKMDLYQARHPQKNKK